MEAALKSEFVSVADYLAFEEASDTKHEYVHGKLYAMAGGTREHNRIAFNCAKALDAHLGRKCQVSISDLKVHIQELGSDAFFYPDVMVTCDSRDRNPLYNSFPTIIVEVLSDSTARVDRIEKLDAYKKIPTLQEYILVSQATIEVAVFRRSADWKMERLTDIKAAALLESIGLSLPLQTIYDGIPLA